MTVVIMLTSLLAVLMTLQVMLTSSFKEARGSKEEINAVFIAEAGLSAAVFDLRNGGTGNLGAEAEVDYAGGAYSVTATDEGDGTFTLMATGSDGPSSARVELVLGQSTVSRFQWAAFGDEEMFLASNAMVDSYDSSAGLYGDQDVNGSGNDSYANSDGDVGSNGNIELSQNSVIHGDAVPGPGGSTTIIGGNAGVDGSTAPNSSTVEMPPIDVPVIASSGALSISGSSTLASGAYHFDSLDVAVGSTLTVTGPATLVFGSFLLRSNSEFRVDASAGPVEVYVIDDFVMNSNTLVASLTYTPVDLMFNLLSDNVIDPDLNVDLDEVDFESNAQLYGTIYAPNAAIEINSNFELFGSIVSRRLALNSNAQVHYDESLMSATSSNDPGDLETIAWRVLR